MRKKRWLYRVGDEVRFGESDATYVVVGHEPGSSAPYRIEHAGTGRRARARKEELRRVRDVEKAKEPEFYAEITITKEETIMGCDEAMRDVRKGGTIRQKIRELRRTSDERNAIEVGFLSDEGNLTEVGRRTLLDYIWEGDEALRERVFADIAAVLDVEKADKKKTKK